jgi:putative endonuclease
MNEYWSVYIVRCADATLYTGVTNNLKNRIAAHNDGSGAKYTMSRTPVKLVFSEIHTSKSTAMQREYAIKQLTRVQKEELIQT